MVDANFHYSGGYTFSFEDLTQVDIRKIPIGLGHVLRVLIYHKGNLFK